MMEEKNNDEIDLFQLYNKIKTIFKGWIVSLFNAFYFILKNWIIIAILIFLGGVLGYFSQLDYKPSKKAIALIRINFDSVDYVYSEVELINEKLNENDSLFFDKNGFRADTLEISEIKILPIINLNDILEKYELNDRKLEGLLKNLEFDEEDFKVSETFTSEYNYHKIELSLSNVANKKTIINTLNYINNNYLLNQLRDTIRKDIKLQIKNNIKSIKQIDKVLDTYQTNQSLSSSSDQIYIVDKNFSIHAILEKKMELQTINESLSRYLVYSKDIAVLVNKPNIIKEKRRLLDNKVIIYPIILVVLFLFLSFLKFIYLKLEKVANESRNNK